jgi:hypothetical protein
MQRLMSLILKSLSDKNAVLKLAACSVKAAKFEK